jgi:hypothetical protein
MLQFIVTTLLCSGWFYLFLSDRFVESHVQAAICLLLLVILTYFALRAFVRSGRTLDNGSLTFAAITLATFMFLVWSTLIANIELGQFLRWAPQSVRFWGLVAPSVMSAFSLAVLSALPMAVLFRRTFWRVQMLTALMVFAFQYDLLIHKPETISRRIILFDFAALLLLVPLFTWFLMSRVGVLRTLGSLSSAQKR